MIPFLEGYTRSQSELRRAELAERRVPDQCTPPPRLAVRLGQVLIRLGEQLQGETAGPRAA